MLQEAWLTLTGPRPLGKHNVRILGWGVGIYVAAFFPFRPFFGFILHFNNDYSH